MLTKENKNVIMKKNNKKEGNRKNGKDRKTKRITHETSSI